MQNPIVLVEDDLDDQELIREALAESGIENKLIIFENCKDCYNFLLNTTQPILIILCDVNLPEMNGMEFKKKIDDNEELRKRSIPFVFHSTAVSKKYVDEAYTKLTVQGFFKNVQISMRLRNI